MAGFGSPQAAVAAAVQQAIAQSGGSTNYANFDQLIVQNLQQAGFTPQQIQAVMAGEQAAGPTSGVMQNAGGGNTAGEMAAWTGNINAALNAAGVGQNQTPNAATTNAASPTNNANPIAAMQAPNQSVTPATIQGQFPGGLPSYTPSGVANQPSVTAQQIMGTSVNPTTIDPNMSIAATEAYLQPQFQQQDAALTANLANAGIVGGTAPQAQAQLGQQQQTTLQNDIQPFLQAGALANQSTNLQGQLANQSNAFNVATANQGANLNAQQFNVNTGLQGSEYNATAQNQAQQFNIQNLLQTGQIDAATANQMMQYVMGMQNQDWLAQLGAQTNLATTAEGGQNAAFNPTYQQPPQINLGGFGTAVGSAFQVPQPQQQSPNQNQNQAQTPGGPGGNTAGAIQTWAS